MTSTDTARDQAKAQLESIKLLVDALDAAERKDEAWLLENWKVLGDHGVDLNDHFEPVEKEEEDDGTPIVTDYELISRIDLVDDIRERIHEDPLSVLVRSEWVEPGQEMEAAEYQIELCWGGPAVRIRGNLDRFSEPLTARLEYQDWDVPWTEYITTGEDHDALIAYAQQFC